MNKRIEWIDTLRGFAMFYVILGHAFVTKSNFIRKYIYSFHMPLFFFISGMTSKKYDLSWLDFLKKKAKSLLLPYLCLNIFVLILKYLFHFTLGIYNNLDLTQNIIHIFKGYSNTLPCIQSWFIICLFVIEVLFYAITKYIKNDKSVALAVIAVFILGYLNSIYSLSFLKFWHIDTALVGLLFYYLGYIFMKYLPVYNKVLLENKYIVLSGLLLVIGYLLQSVNGKISMNGNEYANVAIFLLASMVTIIGILVFVNIILKKSKLFRGIGVMSIFFLGYHGFILTIFKSFYPSFLSSDILTILTSFITLLIIYPIAVLALKYTPILVGKFK